MRESEGNSETEPLLKKKKYLILTSAGGGGHINAAQARKRELIDLGVPESEIDIIDIMGLMPKSKGSANEGDAWIPTYSFFALDPVFSGEANTAKWDNAQREGTEEAVRKLEDLVTLQPFAERIQAERLQKRLENYLQEYDVQTIFNTQALSTPAICQAVVNHNQDRDPEKQISITTTVTDIVTHRAAHFLSPLRNLSAEQQAVLKMEIATAPMTAPGETQEQFQEKYGIPAGLFVPKAKLGYRDGNLYKEDEHTSTTGYTLPVKREVLNYDEAKDKSKVRIKANIKKKVKTDGKEEELIDPTEYDYLKGQLRIKDSAAPSEDIEIEKKPSDKLITITMGSQGSNTVIEYMDSFLDQVLQNQEQLSKSKGDIYLCIAAGASGQGSLYERVKTHSADIMEKIPKNLRSRVKILPLAFQDGKHMASLLSESDVLITRSGGMSAMEAKATNGRNPDRQVFIHSEAKLKYPDNFPKHSFDATYEALMQGTVKWEGGNAEYLLREIDASLGSPEVIDFGLTGQKGEKLKPKENSLFHFAYDGKLNNEHAKKIEQLILEGSNPNMRFPDGSYLIDYCQDLETKVLLIKYGAEITPRALKFSKHEEQQAIDFNTPIQENWKDEYKKQIQKARVNYLKTGFPKPEADASDKIKNAYLYLNPKQPKGILEHMIVGIDKVGDFIRNRVLMVDYVHDVLDSTRLYLKTDPTEPRSPLKRLRQLRNFVIDTSIFIAKQPIYAVTKPIALATNAVKAGLLCVSILNKHAHGEKSNISSVDELKKTGKRIVSDAKKSLVAWGSAALVMSGFGTPIAFSIGGVSASISFGAASFGVASPAIAKLNAAAVQAAAATSNPAFSAVTTAETVAEWGVVRPFFYFRLNPKKLYYKDKEGTELNVEGKNISELHKVATNRDIDINVRRQAREAIDNSFKGVLVTEVGARVAKAALTPFEESEDMKKRRQADKTKKQR